MSQQPNDDNYPHNRQEDEPNNSAQHPDLTLVTIPSLFLYYAEN